MEVGRKSFLKAGSTFFPPHFLPAASRPSIETDNSLGRDKSLSQSVSLVLLETNGRSLAHFILLGLLSLSAGSNCRINVSD